MDLWHNGGMPTAGADRLIKTIDMHTTGEPTRIIVSGYPTLEGNTLLEKRAHARRECDHIRRRLMHEPRGHRDMYGAILVPETELTAKGDADIGVLFCHNEGYSTMCGHATIALGRFLVDTQDTVVFPRRALLDTRYDEQTGTTQVVLHAPCGRTVITVPCVRGPRGLTSDPRRAASFLGVPSFVSKADLAVRIPEERRWSGAPESVTVDIVYGGAFYAVVHAGALGFPAGLDGTAYTLQALDDAAATLKAVLAPRTQLFAHPTERDLEFLYGIIIVDPARPGGACTLEEGEEPVVGADTGLCFFADREVDRSPTGSGVMARAALAVARGELELGARWAYHSIVSAGVAKGEGAFVGTAVEKVRMEDGREGVVARVEGRAYYTGAGAFGVEESDPLKDGFVLAL